MNYERKFFMNIRLYQTEYQNLYFCFFVYLVLQQVSKTKLKEEIKNLLKNKKLNYIDILCLLFRQWKISDILH